MTCGPDAPRPRNEAPARYCVEPGSGHGDRAGGTAVDVEDARTELHGVGLRSEVAEDRHGVEAVEFRHPADIDAGLLQISGFGRASRGSPEYVSIIDSFMAQSVCGTRHEEKLAVGMPKPLPSQHDDLRGLEWHDRADRR